MKRIIILTGSETRHSYFKLKLSNDSRFTVLATLCEGLEESLSARTNAKKEPSELEKRHVAARERTEREFFGKAIEELPDRSNSVCIKKGAINTPGIVEFIKDKNPDLLVCYGSSLIKSDLLEMYQGRFLNVHLGLSPHYRGSGTNIWPLITGEPHMVGATFMHIDKGIDTGQIIHQIRANFRKGDTPHTIGNRLIGEMTEIYAELIARFDTLSEEIQPAAVGKLYLRKDFDADACAALYRAFEEGLVEKALKELPTDLPYIVQNKALERNR
jgi:phosphoribosylglycinamide formyltransferase-1